jgi:leader peptidase (prepilin peptidase)/N-methyltransferase
VNAALAAAGAAAATILYWTIAADAAGRRDTTIGTLPLPIPALVGAAAFAGAWAGLPPAAIGAFAGATVAGVVDARTGFIFDPLTRAMLLVSLLLSALDSALLNGLYGGAAVGGSLLLLHALSGGRGFGLGDVKLGAALGVALGLSSGLLATALAFIFGGVYGGWMLATKRATPRTPVRFGPFIAAGAFAAVLAR